MAVNFREEKLLWKQGYKVVVGLDEAGRGPLAGPVVAAAVVVNAKIKKETSSSFGTQKSKLQLKIKNLKIKDSKQLSEKKREEFYSILTSHPDIKWGIGIVSEKVIDKINILEATKLAMKKALRQAQGKLKRKAEFLILDGNFTLNKVKLPQKPIIGADGKVFSCAAAGIIAKVTRDQIMREYHKKYPGYGFDRHKGYGTKLHVRQLEILGPCGIHRKTFEPVKDLIK